MTPQPSGLVTAPQRGKSVTTPQPGRSVTTPQRGKSVMTPQPSRSVTTPQPSIMRCKPEEGRKTLHLLASIYREHEIIAQRHKLLSVLLVFKNGNGSASPGEASCSDLPNTSPQGSPNSDFHHETSVSIPEYNVSVSKSYMLCQTLFLCNIRRLVMEDAGFS